MPKISYLSRDKKSGCYYFRKVVPTNYQPLYGKVIKISLRTKERKVAEVELWKQAQEWADKFLTGTVPDRTETPSMSRVGTRKRNSMPNDAMGQV